MKNTSASLVSDAEKAFLNFQAGLSCALKVSKEELDRRVALDDARRTADRVQRGYAKRGPKAKTSASRALGGASTSQA